MSLRFKVWAVDARGHHWIGSQWDTLDEAKREARRAFRNLWFDTVKARPGLYTGPRVLVLDSMNRTPCGAVYTVDHSNMEAA